MIKVERASGDFARGYDTTVHGMSSYFVWLNRSKESLTLDLKSEDGRQAIRTLIAGADVFIQNLAPGAAARLGLAADDLRAEDAAGRLVGGEQHGDRGGLGHVAARGVALGDQREGVVTEARGDLGVHSRPCDLQIGWAGRESGDRRRQHPGESFTLVAAQIEAADPALLVGVCAQRREDTLPGHPVDGLATIARCPDTVGKALMVVGKVSAVDSDR